MSSAGNIPDLFRQQENKKIVSLPALRADYKLILIKAQQPWDEDEFRRLLSEWVVVNDQPFTTVEDEQFQTMLRYVHRGPSLHIPTANTIKAGIKELKLNVYQENIDLIKVRAPNNYDDCNT